MKKINGMYLLPLPFLYVIHFYYVLKAKVTNFFSVKNGYTVLSSNI